MGTRGAFGFKFDQKEIIFYNHWDSYPSGLGNDIVNYVKSVTDWNLVRDKVTQFNCVNEEIHPTPEQKLRAYQLGTVNLGVSKENDNDWYCLTREAQGNVNLTLDLGFGVTSNSFLRDSLFCEYAYIINLDTMELEFYEGFNSNRLADGRYANVSLEEWSKHGYAGVKLNGCCQLDNIPDDWESLFYPEPSE